MHDATYLARRSEIENYFDRKAASAWEQLTSDAPVGRIRATVRAGRDRMRATLLGYLPLDLRGLRVLDAGCGTGALAVEAARRGAEVLAVDLSPTLVAHARARATRDIGPGRVAFCVGDMLDASAGSNAQPGDGSREWPEADPRDGLFDHVVAMDSLIHYRAADCVAALSRLVARARRSVVLTFAPRTPALALMHAVGRLVPHRRHRAPAIEPVAEDALRRRLAAEPALAGWHVGRTQRVRSGFYTSQALELVRR